MRSANKLRSLCCAVALTGASVGAYASPAEWGGQVGPMWVDSGLSVVGSLAQLTGAETNVVIDDMWLGVQVLAVNLPTRTTTASVQISAPVQSSFYSAAAAPQLDKSSVVVMGATPTPPISASATDDGDGIDGGDGADGGAAAGDDGLAGDGMMPPVLAVPIAETDDMMAAVPAPAPLLLVLLGLAGIASRRR